MKRTNFLTTLILITICNAFAGNDRHITSRRGYVTVFPVYQSWTIEDSVDFSEISTPITLYFPLSRNFGMTLRGSQAIATGDKQNIAAGDNLGTLRGVSDTQLSFSYHVEAANLVLNLGLNLPSGKRKLTENEFNTSILLSNNIYNIRLPNLGQGFNIAPGFTLALPVSANLVLGVGASYQIKGKFKPLSALEDDYDPGEEILATGGFDLRLSETATFSSDVIFTIFGTDKIGDKEVFAPGNRLVANVQFRKYFNFHELRFFARYRSREKNDRAIILGEKLSKEPEKTFPNQLEIMAHFRIRFGRSFYTRLLVEGRLYQEAPAFVNIQDTPNSAGINLLGFGIAPEISPSSNFRIPMTFKYFTGSFKDGPKLSGFELGLGFSVSY